MLSTLNKLAILTLLAALAVNGQELYQAKETVLDPASSDSNHRGWKDAKATALFMASQQELDPGKRAAQYQEAQKIWLEAAPFVLLYERPFPVALGKAVNDYAQTPLGNMIFVRSHLTR